MPAFPSGEAIAVTYDATISASTGVTFSTSPKSTEIEVTAIDKGIFMNWGTVAASSTVFDNFIPAGSSKRFVIPSGVLGATFIQEAATAKLVVVEK